LQNGTTDGGIYNSEAVKRSYIYHAAALLTAVIWGTTFVSTKVLIVDGLMPQEVFFWRFAIAYIGIALFSLLSRSRLFADSLRDELMLAAGGVFGGSLYFMAENTALKYTLAGNVSILTAVAPLFTALVARMFYPSEKLRPALLWGSVVALLGVGLVVFNGNFILKLSPMGDILTLLAALCWAFYGSILRDIGNRYPTMFITRKVFFYGLVTLIPFIIFGNSELHLRTFGKPAVAFNLLYLGMIASLACYFMWNSGLRAIGVVRASNYLYLVPLVTLITSAIVIGERVTPVAMLGAAFILAGVWMAGRRG